MSRFFIFLISVFTSALCIASSSIDGWWKGRVALMPIVFHIEEHGDTLSGQLYSPTQTAEPIPLSHISIAGDTLLMRVDMLGVTYRGVVHNQPRSIKGTFTQGRQFGMTLTPATESDARLYRPQTPQPPYFYSISDVTFTNDPLTLAATVTTPVTTAPAGAIVLVSGSGSQNRDEEILGHKPFAVIADFLTRCGWTVLRYDDRGVGGSSIGSHTDTTFDFATDALAATRYLRRDSALKGKPIGILGHSEGGTIAMINAAEYPDEIDFIISLAGPAIKGIDLMVRQNEMIAENGGIHTSPARRDSLYEAFSGIADIADTDSLKQFLRQKLASLSPNPSALENTINQVTTPWYHTFVALDPAEYLTRIKCPMLALNGLWDIQVEAGPNLQAISRAVPNATVKALPGLNHMFQESASKAASFNYGSIQQTILPTVLDIIADFLVELSRQRK